MAMAMAMHVYVSSFVSLTMCVSVSEYVNVKVNVSVNVYVNVYYVYLDMYYVYVCVSVCAQGKGQRQGPPQIHLMATLLEWEVEEGSSRRSRSWLRGSPRIAPSPRRVRPRRWCDGCKSSGAIPPSERLMTSLLEGHPAVQQRLERILASAGPSAKSARHLVGGSSGSSSSGGPSRTGTEGPGQGVVVGKRGRAASL